MKENDRWLTEAMDHLDPALIEDMDGQAAVKRRPAPMRVMLVAACICALLAVGAVAVSIAGNLDFPWGDISTEAKVAIHTANAENLDPSHIAIVQTFDSQKELREFLAIPIPQNAYLDEPPVWVPEDWLKAEEQLAELTSHSFAVLRNRSEMRIDNEGGYGSVHCRLSATETENAHSRTLFAESHYTIVKDGFSFETGNWTIPFNVYMYATWFDDKLLAQYGPFDIIAMARERTEEDGLIFREEYTTAAGLEAVICGIKDIPSEGESIDSVAIEATFESGGAYYVHSMCVFYPDEETMKEAVDILKSILDAYEVPRE